MGVTRRHAGAAFGWRDGAILKRVDSASRWIRWPALGIVAWIALWSGTIAPASAQDPLRVVYCEDCAPFQMRDEAGEASGLIIDLWRIWQGDTGRTIEWIAAPWTETLRLMREGAVDAHAGLFERPDRAVYMDFGTGIHLTDTKAFVHRALPRPASVDDFSAYRIGVLEGDAVQAELERETGAGAIVPYRTYASLMADLKSGALKAFAADAESALYHLSEAGLNSDFPISNALSLYTSNWHVAVPKGGSATLAELNEGFSSLSAERRAAVLRRWADGKRSEQPDALIIALYEDYAPMSFVSPTGEPAGLLVDVWRRWSQETGKAIRFRLSNWPDTLAAVRNGYADIHSGLFKSIEREQWMAFSRPFHLVRTAVYGRAEDGLLALDSLNGKRLGVLQGTFQEEELRWRYPEVDVVGQASDESEMIALLRGDVDAVANEVIQSDTTLARLGYSGLIRRGPTVLTNELYAGVALGRQDLLEEINAGLAAIPRGKLAAIERRWLPNPEDHYYAPSSFRMSDEERTWLTDQAPLSVAVTNFIDSVDVFDVSGAYTGFNADLIQRLEDLIGVEIVPRVFSRWNALVDAALAGEVDLALSLSKTEARLEKLLFTDAYANDPLILVSRSGSAETVDFDSLGEATVGILKGVAFEPAIRLRIGRKGELVAFEADADGLAAVSAGDIDVYATSLVMFVSEQRKRRDPNLIVAASELSEGGALRIAVPKDRETLHRIMTKALAAIPASELAALRRKWIEPAPVAPDAGLRDAVSSERARPVLESADMITRLGIGGVLLAIGVIVIIAILRSVMRGNAESVFRSKTLIVSSSLMIVGVLGATVVATLFILDIMERQNRQRLAENLEATIIGRGAHLESWVKGGLHRAVMLSENETLVRAIGDLVQGTPGAAAVIANGLSNAHVTRFAIIDDRGRTVMTTARAPGGGPLSWREVNPEALRSVLSGKPSFFAPFHVAGDAEGTVQPVAFFSAPISLGPDQPDGAIIAEFDLRESLSDVLLVGRFFESGESYAFDRDGYLISQSRFSAQLVEQGQIGAIGDEVLNVRVVIPGGDGDVDPVFTNMAEAALLGLSGVSVKGGGYLDYRGVPVFGAWVWIEEHGIGLTTEVDVEEALGAFRTTRNIVIALVGGAVLVGLGLTGFSIWTGRSASLSLARANANLEERVAERTREINDKEQLLRITLEQMPGGLFMIDAKQKLRFYNHQLFDMLDIPLERAYVGMPWSDVLWIRAERGEYGPGDPSELVRQRLAGYAETPNITTEDRTATGRILQSRRSATDDGGVIVAVTDVTERKTAEESARASEARAQRNERRSNALLQAAPDATLIVDPDGIIQFANDQAERIFGYGRSELVDQSVDQLLPEASRAGHPELRSRFLSEHSARPMGTGLDLWAQRKDGEVFPVEINLSPIETEDGIVVAAAVRDVTERKKAQEKLRASEARLELIMETSPAAATIAKPDGTLTFVTHQTAQMFGYDRALDMIGTKATSFYNDPNDRATVLDLLTREGIVANFSTVYRRADGTTFDGLISMVPAEFDDGEMIIAWVFDVSELRAAQRALEETQKELAEQFGVLNTVLENIDQGVVLRNASLDLEIFNSRFLELFGVPDGTFEAGVNYEEMLRFFVDRGDFGDEDQTEALTRRVEQTRQLAQSGKQETREISRNAPGRVLEQRANPIDDGKYVITYTDVTERKAAEERIREQGQLLNDVLQSLAQGVGAFDGEGRLIAWNDRYQEALGFESAILRFGQSLEDLIADVASRQAYGGGNTEEIARERAEQLRSGLPVRREFFQGDRVYDAISAPTPDGGVVITYTCITDRKRSEEAMRENEERLSIILNTSSAACSISDLEGRIRFVNRRSSDLMGYTAEEFQDMDAAALYADSERWKAISAELHDRGEVREQEAILIRKDGSAVETLVSLRRMEFSEGPRIVSWAYDVSQSKALERELFDAKAIAEEAARAKSDFLATMSHEIRTPMNGVVTMAQILDETRLTADQREMTKTIRQSSEALLIIINDILDFSKIEAGRLAIERVSFDLLDQVESVADLIAPRAEAGSLLFTVMMDDGLPAKVTGDPSRVRQILLNLCGNAVKFTESGSVTLSVSVVGGRDGASCRLRFEIMDTGIGMTEEQVGGLFQAFAQAESSTARRFGGTGLGLAISKRLVELMDGEIGVDTTPGDGSTFWFELPFEIDVDDYLSAPYDLSAAKVVLAGYDGMESDAITRSLVLGGVRNIVSVTDPEHVRAPGEDGEVDLVILDGRPGVPSVVEWGRIVPETLGADHPYTLVTAPHMALSALQLDQSVMPETKMLGTTTVPLHTRRLWDIVAVSLGLITRESLNATSDAAVTYVPPDHDLARAEGAMVLVAEDNPTNQMVISRVLGRMGIAHEMAENGVEALELLDARPFHMLLSDFHMPVMDGFELTQRIRAQEAEDGLDRLPIVALTADVLPETAKRCEEVGMDGYLKKPIEIERLEDVFRSFIPRAFEIRVPRSAETEPEPSADDTAPEGSAPAAASGPRQLIVGVDPDIFDPDALVDAFGDFDEDAADFVLAFLGSLGEAIGHIEAAFEASDFDQARHHAHAMKGAALSTGAVRMGRLMKDIQDALDDGDSDTADIYREGLPETYEELTEALAPLNAARSAA